MLYAVKGNKEKTIDESMIESCLSQGYDIVNEQGVVIKETIPTDLPSLKLAYRKHEDTIKALQAENDKLKAELDALKSEKPIDEPTPSKRKGSSKVVSNE